MKTESGIVQLSSKKFLILCAVLSGISFFLGQFVRFPGWFIALEVLATVLALFILGSIRWRLDKNALTYGAGLVITTSFFTRWWPESALRSDWLAVGPSAFGPFIERHFFSLKGLEHLIHADTMLFILGLTFFVAVIAQTRILETVSFIILNKTKGALFPTIGIIAGLVAMASGILDGVSMIGLMIRTLFIILFLAKVKDESLEFAVVVSTVITTVCGMWLAYGEPPNLIMKANLQPFLNDAFFIKYCLPAAVGSYLVVLFNLWKRLKGKRINTQTLDVLESHSADVKFIQAARLGKILTPYEFVDEHKDILGKFHALVLKRIHMGESLGEALVRANVPKEDRRTLLEKFVSHDLVELLDDHFNDFVAGKDSARNGTLAKIFAAFEKIRKQRISAQIFGGISFIPFVGLLVVHAVNHHFPLFVAPFAGFLLASLGIWAFRKMFRLAIKDAFHEYAEYLFLLPLFLSISFLQKTGFFAEMAGFLQIGIQKFGVAHVAAAQYLGTTFLSAMLDNNVVADFGSRALHGLELGTLYLFSMAQIAGYATGGCWTHIGSAQSVVAYSFIKNQINDQFTPFKWIKLMTPIVLQISAFLLIWVYLIGVLHIVR